MKDTLFFIISERNKTNSIISSLHDVDIEGGTVINAEGSAPPGFLSKIGLSKTEKAMLMVICDRKNEEVVYSLLENKFNFKEVNTGIAFSMPVLRYSNQYMQEVSNGNSDLFCLFVILDHGKSEKVIHALYKAGQKGATLIRGRGAGVPESLAFDFVINEEKDILILLTLKENKSKAAKAIDDVLDIKKRGAGFMFSIPVIKSIGIDMKG